MQSQNLLIFTRNAGKDCCARTSYDLDAVEAGHWNGKCSVASQLDSFILPNILEFTGQCRPCCESATLQMRQEFLREKLMSKCQLEELIDSVSM